MIGKVEIDRSIFPGKAKRLLNDLRNKIITYDDFLKETSYWHLEYLEEYRYRPAPTKPQEVVDFLDRVKDNPHYEAKQEFWRIPHIAFYIIQSLKIEGENRGNYSRLIEIKKNLPVGDNISKDKVQRILDEYSQFWLDINQRVHFKKQEEYTPNQDKEAEERKFWGND
jgi:hypothetical protein